MYAVFHSGRSVSRHIWHKFAMAILYFCNVIALWISWSLKVGLRRNEENFRIWVLSDRSSLNWKAGEEWCCCVVSGQVYINPNLPSVSSLPVFLVWTDHSVVLEDSHTSVWLFYFTLAQQQKPEKKTEICILSVLHNSDCYFRSRALVLSKDYTVWE